MTLQHTEPIFKSEVIKYLNDIRTTVGYVDSKYLRDANGNYVIDPTSPIGEPYIIPAVMDYDAVIRLASENRLLPPIEDLILDGALLLNFRTNGHLDLQRYNVDGKSYEGFVSDYTSIASFFLEV